MKTGFLKETNDTMTPTTLSCASCCGPIAESLARLGSVRCHDCIEARAPVREACVTGLDSGQRAPRELDHRESNGVAVTLLWHEGSDRVVLRVVDSDTDEEFELAVPGRDALDAFHHPYAYLLPAAA
jgi:hypothetical protein